MDNDLVREVSCVCISDNSEVYYISKQVIFI